MDIDAELTIEKIENSPTIILKVTDGDEDMLEWISTIYPRIKIECYEPSDYVLIERKRAFTV